MLCHFLLLSQDFVQQLSRNLWLLRCHHRNHHPANPACHTHLRAGQLQTGCAGGGMGRESSCRWRSPEGATAWRLLMSQGLPKGREKGPAQPARPRVLCEHLSTASTVILEPAPRAAGCVLALGADQLCPQQAQGFWHFLACPSPSHTKGSTWPLLP